MIAAVLALAAAGAADAPVAIEHARLHPGDGRRIDDGTVVLRGGTIAALGPAAEVAVPADARRIDGHGAWVTPGLIDAEALTGLGEIAHESSTVEWRLDERYDSIRAAFSVLDGFNPRALDIPVARLEGVTSSVIVPRGGLVAGRGAVVAFEGDTVDRVVVRSPAGVWASLGEGGRAAGFGARGGALLRLRELVDDVRQYTRRRDEFERNQMRKVSASRLDLEALVPVVEGRLPLVIDVDRAADIQAALRFAAAERLHVVLSGCEEGHLVARDIAAAHVPVVVSAMPDLPRSFSALAATMENAARLARAGVTVAISAREGGDHSSRRLRFEAGNAVAYGLPWETALAAVTAVPARIFGVADRIGSLAPGRSADLVVWSGDPFEPLTRPRHVFVHGRDLPLRSRQTDLRDRYRDLRSARPRP
jgi:imidazolonepropionase-like amidohydrolase